MQDHSPPPAVATPDPTDLLPLRAAAKLIPSRRGGRPCAVSTLWRWSLTGSRGIKLRTWRLGATICTTAAALREFIERCSLQAAPSPTPAPFPNPVTSDLRQAEAQAVLAAAGIIRATDPVQAPTDSHGRRGRRKGCRS